jgi:hypothetical protein
MLALHTHGGTNSNFCVLLHDIRHQVDVIRRMTVAVGSLDRIALDSPDGLM